VLLGNVNNLHCAESVSSDGFVRGLPCLCVCALSSQNLAARVRERSEGLYVVSKIRGRHMGTWVR
jgi:hypothetical protein